MYKRAQHLGVVAVDPSSGYIGCGNYKLNGRTYLKGQGDRKSRTTELRQGCPTVSSTFGSSGVPGFGRQQRC